MEQRLVKLHELFVILICITRRNTAGGRIKIRTFIYYSSTLPFSRSRGLPPVVHFLHLTTSMLWIRRWYIHILSSVLRWSWEHHIATRVLSGKFILGEKLEVKFIFGGKLGRLLINLYYGNLQNLWGGGEAQWFGGSFPPQVDRTLHAVGAINCLHATTTTTMRIKSSSNCSAAWSLLHLRMYPPKISQYQCYKHLWHIKKNNCYHWAH